MRIQAVDSDQEVDQYVPSLEELISLQADGRRGRLLAMLFGAFGVLALVLAIAGLYSVVSHSVAGRTNEFGIRMALGAQRSHVFRVLLSTSAAVGADVLAGLLFSAGLNSLLLKWADTGSRDPFLLLAAALLLVFASLLAAVLPARRASTIDPTEALRYQ
jgi:putative ABC transport system permease protein